MSLISMAVYDTAENQRTKLTEQTLNGLFGSVDFTKHRMFIIDNNSCQQTKQVIDAFVGRVDYLLHDGAVTVITLPQNIGTAKAVNLGWVRRKPGEHCIKIDNDVIIHSKGWIDEMEEAIAREPKIGILGLKRKDLIECTTHETPEWRSQLIQLSHEPGERWIVVEKANGIMGTCQMVNSALIDKIGYLSQPTVYGFDDSIYSCRSTLAGFMNCFLPHIEIDHIDPGGTSYIDWKHKHASETMGDAQRLINEYHNGRDLFEQA